MKSDDVQEKFPLDTNGFTEEIGDPGRPLPPFRRQKQPEEHRKGTLINVNEDNGSDKKEEAFQC